MNKIVIFALLGISTIYCAAITIPASGSCASPNVDVSGVCQLRPSFLCKTYSTAGACTACEATSAGTFTAAPDCSCSGTNLFGQKSSAWDCAATEDVAAITCPDGWGKTNVAGGTNKGRCKICTNLACKACDATTAGTEALGTCSACYASGGTLASGACPAADTTVDKLIPGHGWIAACPDGYVEETVGTVKHCNLCLPGCKTCTATDKATKCATCKEGFLLDTNNKCLTAVDAAGGTNACDATCADKKCHTTKTKCTTCAADHEFTAADTCTKKPVVFGCKTYDTADATKCSECETDYTLTSDKKCRCAATKYIKTTSYAAASGTTAATYFKQECTACDPVCAAGKQCKADSNACEDAPAPTVACDDATLKDGGCNTCAKATEGDMKDKFVCSACSTDQTAATTGSKACSCKSTTHAWDKTNRKCVKCEAECTTAAPSCNLGTDGKATCGAAPATTGTDDAGTNGILISAVSMILAVILA